MTVQEYMETERMDIVIVEDSDGSRLQVYNHVSVSNEKRTHVRGNGEVETRNDITIYAGRSRTRRPHAVTKSLAETLWNEMGIDVDDHNIRVIDPDDEQSTVL